MRKPDSRNLHNVNKTLMIIIFILSSALAIFFYSRGYFGQAVAVTRFINQIIQSPAGAVYMLTMIIIPFPLTIRASIKHNKDYRKNNDLTYIMIMALLLTIIATWIWYQEMFSFMMIIYFPLLIVMVIKIILASVIVSS